MKRIKLKNHVFLVVVILLHQFPASFSLDMDKPVKAEEKVKMAQMLRDLRDEMLSQEMDIQIINGGGTTPTTNRLLYDPYTRLSDSKGRPSVDWLTSYGGEPFGFEIAFVALIPIILAKLLRIFRNFFRPNLHLRSPTADFPLVPLIYLQQTKIEARVKRPTRNGIDWLGKKFLIHASDNIVDSIRVTATPLSKGVPRNPWVLLKLMTRFTAALNHVKDKADHEHAPGAVYPHPTHESDTVGTESANNEGPKTKKNVTILSPPRPGLQEPESTTGLSSEETTGAEDTKTSKGALRVLFTIDASEEIPKPMENDKKQNGKGEDDGYDEDYEDEDDKVDVKKDPRKKSRTSKQKKRKVTSRAKNIKKDLRKNTTFQVISEKPIGGAGEQGRNGTKGSRSKPPAWEQAPEVGTLETDLPSNLRQLKNFSPPKDSKNKRGPNRDPEIPSSPESDDK